jgi:type I restriction enzyme, S subunit
VIKIEAKDHYPVDVSALPPTWDVAFVGDVCSDVQSGFASGEHNSTGDGVPHLRPMNVDRNGQLDMSVTKSVARGVDPRRLRLGDVLFNNTNSPVLVGKTAAISVDADVAFSNHMTRLRPHAGIDYRFLARQLHYLWMGGYFRVRCTNHVNQASVSAATLASSVPVVIPPSNEQVRIVEEVDSLLSRLDGAVADLDAAQRKLKAYRASTLKTAVEGQLVPTEAELARKEGRSYERADVLLERILEERRRRWEEAELAKMTAAGKTPKDDKWKAKYKAPSPPDATNLPPLPEGWCWATAQQLTLRITDGEHITPPRTDHGVLLLSARNVGNEGLLFDEVDFISEDTHQELSRRLNIEAGDVLLSCSGTVGRTCVVPAGLRFSLVRSVAVLKPLLVDSQYLSRALASPLLQAQVHRRKKQTAQANIFQGEIAQLVFPLPPHDEQRRIVEEVERLESVQNSTRKSVSTELVRIRRLRQAILRWAFEGRLVDQAPADEPADVLLARIRAEHALAVAGPSKQKRGRKLKAAS